LSDRGVDIPPSVDYAKDEDIREFNSIQNHILADRKTPYASTKFESAPASIRMNGKEVKPLNDGIDQAVRSVGIFALF
jgi:hypothetical protein